MNLRLGLCCVFIDEPIKFNTTTVTHILKLDRAKALQKLAGLCMNNAKSLMQALEYCLANKIGHFRINSHILPCYTHSEAGYKLEDLPDYKQILDAFQACGEYAKINNIRTAFHPDQFVVLNSKNPETVSKSIEEIEYQSMVAEWVNCDVVNIHGGGAFGDKKSALFDFCKNFYRLSHRAKKLLTIENDDKTYTPEDLLPICENLGIPLVYDVHHHRCNKDSMTVEEATDKSLATWDREPLFHISSPINGWDNKNQNQHHDFINISDFPDCWRSKTITIEVEAKAKEQAVKKLLVEIAS
jgi:UV DNA damage endonuclease